MKLLQLLCVSAFALLLAGVSGLTVDFIAMGAVADDETLSTCEQNTKVFVEVMAGAGLTYGDTFVIPGKTFCMQGGIELDGLRGFTVQIDGELLFQDDRDSWPKDEETGRVKEAILMRDIHDMTFTSSEENVAAGKKGVLNGQGRKWWGAIRMLTHGEDRPRLWHIIKSSNIHVEHLLLLDSAYWSFYAEQCDGMFIRHSDVSARITDMEKHDWLDLTAFNTDGWDVTGRNVHIADSNIWNQDDCIAVKDDPVISEDMLFERITCSGLGLVIGSIGSSKVRNITFRDSYLPNTYKGIYLKARWNDAGPSPDDVFIRDILYENILISHPEQWAIWMGPAQQTGQPCSLLWPNHHGKCKTSGHMTWSNIVLRNVTIDSPKQSPGVIIGNDTNPIQGLVFDNVVVKNGGSKPFGEDYFCQNAAHMAVTGGTAPEPNCAVSL
jgi:polygalacturonase